MICSVVEIFGVVVTIEFVGAVVFVVVVDVVVFAGIVVVKVVIIEVKVVEGKVVEVKVVEVKVVEIVVVAVAAMAIRILILIVPWFLIKRTTFPYELLVFESTKESVAEVLRRNSLIKGR